MTTVNFTATKVNKIKSRMMLHGLTVPKWAAQRGYSKQLVYMVLRGFEGKLQSPKAKYSLLVQDLKADGFWPDDEE